MEITLTELKKRVRNLKKSISKGTNINLKEFKYINRMTKKQLINIINKYDKSYYNPKVIQEESLIQTPLFQMTPTYPNNIPIAPPSISSPELSLVPSRPSPASSIVSSSVSSRPSSKSSIVSGKSFGASPPELEMESSSPAPFLSLEYTETIPDYEYPNFESSIEEKELEAGELLQRNIKMKLDRNKAFREVDARALEKIQEEKDKRLQQMAEAGKVITKNVKMKLERKKAIEKVYERADEKAQEEIDKKEKMRLQMIDEIEKTKREIKASNLIKDNIKVKIAKDKLKALKDKKDEIEEDIQVIEEKPKKKKVLKKYKEGKRVRMPKVDMPEISAPMLAPPPPQSSPKLQVVAKPEIAVEKPRLKANYIRPKTAPNKPKVSMMMDMPSAVSSFMSENRPASAGTIQNTGRLAKRITNKFGQYLPRENEGGTPPPPKTIPPLSAMASGMIRQAWNASPSLQLSVENFTKEALKASIKRNRLQKALEDARK